MVELKLRGISRRHDGMVDNVQATIDDPQAAKPKRNGLKESSGACDKV